MSCARMNGATSSSRMPANVSLKALARVTAGFANEVDDVNQYAAVMYAATTNGTALDRRRELPQIMARRPKVATSSLKSCDGPVRALVERKRSGFSNIALAAATPEKAPMT